MKWYRNLFFHKRWVETGEDSYRIVSDASITAYVLDKANFYGLKITKIELNDYSNCNIQFLGDKQSFLCFVRDFINTYKNHLCNISF